MEYTANNNNRVTAILATLVFHGLLLLLFILVVFKTPIPPFPEESVPGVEVNFGTSDDGMGDVQPENQAENASPVSENHPAKASEAKASSSQSVTQNVEDAPPVNKTETPPSNTDNNNTSNKATSENSNPQPQVNANALYKGKNKNDSKGEGETGKPGDQGDKNGSMDSKYHGKGGDEGNTPGPGNGNGPSYSLDGRKIKNLPVPKSSSNEEGQVVVEITVDKQGNVINARAGVKGSTTQNPTLLVIARQAAMSAKFNVDDDAPEEQKGKIIYRFINQ